MKKNDILWAFSIPTNRKTLKRKQFSVFLFLSFFCTFFINALNAQNLLDRKLDFSMSQQTLEEGLWQLSKAADVPFAFSSNHFPSKTYSFSFRQKKLSYILNQMLADTPTTFSWSGNQILIYKKAAVRFTLSGYVEDQQSGERLIGANIYDRVSKKGTTTNEYGFFSLSLNKEHPQIQVSYLGFRPKLIAIKVNKSQRLKIVLETSLTLQEVIVTDKDSLGQMSNSTFNNDFPEGKEIEKLPTLGGEVDILRVMQQLPGVQSGTDGFGGLHVRGGNADQNLILLDGVPIYNPYHALGLYSIFDHKIVKKVEYYRGEFPARYGGRISSVVDVRTKEGNNKAFHGQATVGLIASKIALEGPISKDKGAFFISARRSHLDPFLKKYSKNDRADNGETGFYNYFFGDILGKFNYTFSQKDRVYFSFYKGKDDYHNEISSQDTLGSLTQSFSENQDLAWGNTLGVIRWNHQINNKLFSNLTLTYSRFNFNSNEDHKDQIKDGFILRDQFAFQNIFGSKIETTSAKLDLDYVPNTKNYIRTGITASRNIFTPGISSVQSDIFFIDFGETLVDSILNAPSLSLMDINFYLEDEWQVHPNLRINAGIFSSFSLVKDKSYLLLDPRFSLHWKIAKSLRFNFSANRTSQHLHLLTRSGSGFPNDLWVPSTSKVAPQRSKMIDFGLEWAFLNSWSMAANAYYKKMSKLLNYTESTDFSVNPDLLSSFNWEDRVTAGNGTSKGLEFLLKKKSPKSSSWIAYTLSKTTRQFPDLNSGKTFPFRFDLRHVLNIVSTYDLNDQWSVSANWNYSSGSNISLAFSDWQYIRQDGILDFTYLDFGAKNSYQLPSNHRLDFAIKYNKKTSWGRLSFDLGVYNAYNRVNILYIKPEFDFLTETISYKSVSLIPRLPYFSFNIEL